MTRYIKICETMWGPSKGKKIKMTYDSLERAEQSADFDNTYMAKEGQVYYIRECEVIPIDGSSNFLYWHKKLENLTKVFVKSLYAKRFQTYTYCYGAYYTATIYKYFFKDTDNGYRDFLYAYYS